MRDLLQVTDYGDLRYLLAENYNQNVRSLLSQAEPWAWQTEGVNVPPGKVGFASFCSPVFHLSSHILTYCNDMHCDSHDLTLQMA